MAPDYTLTSNVVRKLAELASESDDPELQEAATVLDEIQDQAVAQRRSQTVIVTP